MPGCLEVSLPAISLPVDQAIRHQYRPHTHSMRQACIGNVLDKVQVPLRRTFAEALAELDKEQKGQDLGEPGERGQDEGVLVSHVGDPRGQAVADGEGHGVADEDHGDDGLAGQIAVAVDAVADTQLETDRVGERDDAHCEYLVHNISLLSCATNVCWGRTQRTSPNQCTW